MNLKKTFGVGLAALLVLGLVAAANSAQNKEKHGGAGFRNCGLNPLKNRNGMNKTAVFEDLGLPENATREEVGEALWQKRLSDLSLTEDSTVRQYRDAVKARMRERREQMMEGLGLDEDATRGEALQAMKADCEENPGDCPQRMGRGMGFGRGFKGFGM